MYFINLFKEINYWLIIKKTTKKNIKFLEENKIRVDPFGRMYTVINLPEEIASQPLSQESYVLSKLRDYDAILLKLNLTELIYPTFEKIDGTDSYLLVLEGSRFYISFRKILFNTILWTVIFFISKFLITAIIDNNVIDYITQFFKNV